MSNFLTSADVIRLVTSSTANIDAIANYVDMVPATGAATPNRQLTGISSATTTTILAAPAAGTIRKVKSLLIRNKHASASNTITLSVYDGASDFEIDKRALGPAGSIRVNEDGSVSALATGGQQTPAWHGRIYGAYGNCDPGLLMALVQRDANIAATATNVSTSVARCCSFVPPADIVVNRIRYYGVGAPGVGVFKVALYRMSDLARLTAALDVALSENTWGSAGSGLNLTLTKDTVYFVAMAATSDVATAGVVCFGDTLAATTGQIQSTPAALPGNLGAGNAYMNGYQFQFAVTTGALPDPAAALAAQAAWTGGMGAFWLDNADV